MYVNFKIRVNHLNISKYNHNEHHKVGANSRADRTTTDQRDRPGDWHTCHTYYTFIHTFAYSYLELCAIVLRKQHRIFTFWYESFMTKLMFEIKINLRTVGDFSRARDRCTRYLNGLSKLTDCFVWKPLWNIASWSPFWGQTVKNLSDNTVIIFFL